MNLLPAQPDCRKCPLGSGCKHAGLPTRQVPEEATPLSRSKALLVIGEAPGYNEDLQAKSWIGWAGQLLQDFLIKAKPFHAHADIYLANAVRCHPQANEDPSEKQLKACREHLFHDIQELYRNYKGNLTILCTGRYAAMTLGVSSLTKGFRTQGHYLSISKEISIPVFYTYHPAALQSRRQPTLIRAISPHLHLLFTTLSGARPLCSEVTVPPRGLLPPATFPPLVSLDIETYGILAGKSQTVFHPVQSCHIDKVKARDLIVTVSLAWRTEPEAPTQSSIYIWPQERDRTRLHSWFSRLGKNKATLLGKNLPFDLSYLRYADVSTHYLLRPTMGLLLDDMGIINHLDFEQRPERSLKNISELFGIASYAASEVTGEKGNALSSYDPELWRYNSLDAIATLDLYYLLWKRIRERYGPRSAKLSDLCTRTRNDLLWTLLHLVESGVVMNTSVIKSAHELHTRRSQRILSWTHQKHGIKLAGNGSAAHVKKIIVDALSPDLLDDPLVAFTPKTKAISTKKDNINLILFRRPIGDPRRNLPLLLDSYRSHAKIVESYTTSLLTKPSEGLLDPDHLPIAYPRWYGIPQHVSKDETDKTGGTIQGRITCKRPALMTFPPSLKPCFTSRFKDGYLLNYDLSQIELRVAALLSGDSRMLREYRNDEDRHAGLALVCWSHLTGNEPDFKDHWRQAAKQLNFLMVYKGGALKFQETLRKEHNIEMDITLCEQAILTFNLRYPEFRQWQDRLIEQACRTGYLEVPTGWSRSFSGGREAILATYTNEICNFPVQCLAAQLMLSSQAAIIYAIENEKLSAVIPTQTYDHLMIDVPSREKDFVKNICDAHLTRPPLMPFLEAVYERTVAIKYELKEKQCLGPSPVNSA